MNLFSDAFIQALCWTLIHSLWEGLAIAMIAGLVILLTKNAGTVFRYNFLTGLLTFFLACVVITFYLEYANQAPAVANQKETHFIAGNIAVQDLAANDVPAKNTGYMSVVVSFLDHNATLIVFAWILIIAFKCSKLVHDIRYIYVLKRRLTSDAGDHWDKRIKELAHKLYISRPVRLLQSGLVKMPVVIGHLKPVILLPAGVLTSLPPDEIEAVLLHELAHIRRKDFLVNILQNLCEIIFFFNPAVQWLSGVIKDERENCCDDIAINEVKSKKQLINALITFQEFEGATAQYAVGFPGRKMHLFNRIKRIMTNNNQTLNNMERTLLATGIVITSIATIAFRQTQTEIVANGQHQVSPATTIKTQVADNTKLSDKSNSVELNTRKGINPRPVKRRDPISTQQQSVKDTVPTEENYRGHHNGTISTTRDGKRYEVYLRNDEIIALYIDDKRIPDDKIGDYKQSVGQIIKEEEDRAAAAREEARHARREAEVARREAEEARSHAERERREANEGRERAERNEHEARERRENEERNVDRIREHREMQENRENAERSRRDAEEARREADRARERTEFSRERAEEARHRAEEARRENERMVKEMVSDLKDQGLIKDDKELSFSISSDELIVNGKKQPESVHAKFKEKYIKEPSTKISYSHKDNHTSFSQDTHED